MGTLAEICSSKYTHQPLDSFGKKYYSQRFGDKRICEECVSHYIADTSKRIAENIIHCTEKISMNDITKYADGNKNEYFNIDLNISTVNYMEYLLPINYKVHLSMVYRKFYPQLELSSLVGREPYIIICNANISSDVCKDISPAFNFSLEVFNTDTVQTLRKSIEMYLEAYINMIYDEMTPGLVQSIMNNVSKSTYSSQCACDSATSAHVARCAMCAGSIGLEYYIYNNTQYCLDCMYDIVVKSTIDCNLGDEVGLSIENGKVSTTYGIVDTAEWKRSVIDKYIIAMTRYGANPNITHYKMTVMG